MKIARFLAAGSERIGIVDGEDVIDSGYAGSMLELITEWDSLSRNLAGSGERRRLADITLLAPVPRPGKIFAIGLNYADHIAESKMKTPERQVWFTKAQTSINAPFAPIVIAKGATFVDYEVELVAVIGKRAKHVSAANAPSHVFGYMVGNDVTERMWQHATAQWSLGKSFDTHAPTGPWITTSDEVGDPHALDLSCTVNGEVRQNSNTRHLVFNLWQQIEHLSAAMTLEPGDLVFTGTPGGVGAAMDPRQFLKAGDVVRCDIEKLGHIEAVMQDEG